MKKLKELLLKQNELIKDLEIQNLEIMDIVLNDNKCKNINIEQIEEILNNAMNETNKYTEFEINYNIEVNNESHSDYFNEEVDIEDNLEEFKNLFLNNCRKFIDSNDNDCFEVETTNGDVTICNKNADE